MSLKASEASVYAVYAVYGEEHKPEAVLPAAPREERADVSPCYACGSTRFWRDRYGNLKCARYHPPAFPEHVAAWVEVEPVVEVGEAS